MQQEIRLSVLAGSEEARNRWENLITEALSRLTQPGEAFPFDREGLGQVVFVDSAMPDMESSLAELDRRGRAVFMMVPEGSPIPPELLDGQVDDLLVHPFRALEVVARIRYYRQILMWEEVARANESFTGILNHLRDDLALAERLQKGRLPIRFADVPGFKVTSRYLAGARSGGDYFDLADSAVGSQLSVLLSDSSSYGLCSAVLGVLMKVAVKLSSEEVRSTLETVKRIHHELLSVLSDRDRLSLFYGVISRKDSKLRYLNLGSSCAFVAAGKGGRFELLKPQGGPISRVSSHGLQMITDSEIPFRPDDRIVLVSDGFVEALGSVDEVSAVLNQYCGTEGADAINELVYRVKSKLTEPDDMPAQDCTAIVLDMTMSAAESPRTLRMAK